MVLALLLLLSAEAGTAAGWRQLFNGRNLDGWVRLNGAAPYTVEDSSIVGTCVANSPNSFLCTTEAFQNFIFECEVKIDWTLNSGVQIRSERAPDRKGGRVLGYQVEIDASDRA